MDNSQPGNLYLTNYQKWRKSFSKNKSWENLPPANWTIRNVKGNSSGKRKMIPDGNLDLHKAIMRTTHGK